MPSDAMPPEESRAQAADASRQPEFGGWRLLACAVLLNAGIAAVIAAGFAKKAADAVPRIASVRLAELVSKQVDDSVRVEAGAEAAAREARAWGQALEEALHTVALRRGVVLLPVRSVAAGALDVTGEVEAEMARLLAEPGS